MVNLCDEFPVDARENLPYLPIYCLDIGLTMKKYYLLSLSFALFFMFSASLQAAEAAGVTVQDTQSTLTEEQKEKQQRMEKFKARAEALGEGKAGAYTPPAAEQQKRPAMDGLYRPQERME